MFISSSTNDNLRRDSLSSESSLLRPGNRHSCDSCEILTCDSIHGSIATNCLVKDCYFCTDIAIISEEISGTYQRLFDLVQKRNQTIRKPHHETFVNRLPVEILSLVFVFVKQTYDNDCDNPLSGQPRTSPPLLVGAICKKWRDITLRTARLWTDIIVNLAKPADTQVDMITEWARRSGVLPVNITVSLSAYHSYEDEEDIPEGRLDVALALRSLAIRWNDVAVFVPWYFCHSLFNNLEESPSISSFRLLLSDDQDALHMDDLPPIKLRHPFRPKSFYSSDLSWIEIPLEWDNLVHVEIDDIKDGRRVLDIIRHAQNLRHWNVMSEYFMSSEDLPETTTYITNRALIYFETNINIILNHLILPSLQQLHYSIGISTLGPTEDLNSLSYFVERSQPPLQKFSLKYDIHRGDPEFSFRRLPGLTSLNVTVHSRVNAAWIDSFLQALVHPAPDVILPGLGEIRLDLPRMTASSWSLFARLLQKDGQLDLPPGPGLNDAKAFTSLSRPLSKVFVGVLYDGGMDEDTFLDLLAVRKAGLDLTLLGRKGVDLLKKTAERYNGEVGEAYKYNWRESSSDDSS